MSGGGSDALPPIEVTRRSLLQGAGGAAVLGLAGKAGAAATGERIVVVGAGVFGAWTAEYLRRAGHQVLLLDSYGPANARATSAGESRMTRAGYGKDLVYARMALDSLADWQALSEGAGLPLFHRHGVLMFFESADEPHFVDTIATHRKLGLDTVAMTAAEMQTRFPMFDFAGIAVGYFEPRFGAIMARRAVQTLVSRFIAAGGAYERKSVASPQGGGDRLGSIVTGQGERIEADRFVFACGPWLKTLFPDVIGPRLFVTRQEQYFFGAPPGDRRFLPPAMPGWADWNGGNLLYGFPDLENRGLMIALDVHGPQADPDRQERVTSPGPLEEVRRFRDRRFPALRGAPVVETRVCQYENSSNGDYLIDRHPRWENVLLVGCGSGHGFKNGPAVGRYAAGLLAGSQPPEPRFSLATKGETQQREVH